MGVRWCSRDQMDSWGRRQTLGLQDSSSVSWYCGEISVLYLSTRA